MSSFAPYVNNGYFDVPIHNQYSNYGPSLNPVKATKYNVNSKIFNTLNNNQESYILDPNEPSLSQPSKSLYTESDIQTTGYYKQNIQKYNGNTEIIDSSDFSDVRTPIIKKKEMVPYIESFDNRGGSQAGGMQGSAHGGDGGYHGGSYGGCGRGYHGMDGHHEGGHGMRPYYPSPSNLFLGSYFPMGYGGYVDTVSDASYYNNIYPVYVEEPPVIIEKPVQQYIRPRADKEIVYIEDVKNESEETKDKSKKKKKTKSTKKVNDEEKYVDLNVNNEKMNKEATSKNNISNKTLWVIIIILSIIILLLIFYRLYEKKLLKFYQ
jgi:hypothetical protein